MVLVQAPKDFTEYVEINGKSPYNLELQENGFMPKYYYYGCFYYKYSEELKDFIEKGGVNNV
ncbi:MAG: hypothetical protein KBT06_11540 [Prevotellaceae bacterium]|nr:hypothetical protein [Candidatus Colivivens equi]